MQKRMQDTRKQVVSLHALAHKTAEAEKNILKSALERLTEVNEEIRKTAPLALTSAADSDRYQGLIVERGRLNTVIGNARRVLAE